MLPDPVFGKNRSRVEFTPPVTLLRPHTAPLGLDFYIGSMFSAQYRNNLFIAERGCGNRENKIGYWDVRLMLPSCRTVRCAFRTTMPAGSIG